MLPAQRLPGLFKYKFSKIISKEKKKLHSFDESNLWKNFLVICVTMWHCYVITATQPTKPPPRPRAIIYRYCAVICCAIVREFWTHWTSVNMSKLSMRLFWLGRYSHKNWKIHTDLKQLETAEASSLAVITRPISAPLPLGPWLIGKTTQLIRRSRIQ